MTHTSIDSTDPMEWNSMDRNSIDPVHWNFIEQNSIDPIQQRYIVPTERNSIQQNSIDFIEQNYMYQTSKNPIDRNSIDQHSEDRVEFHGLEFYGSHGLHFNGSEIVGCVERDDFMVNTNTGILPSQWSISLHKEDTATHASYCSSSSPSPITFYVSIFFWHQQSLADKPRSGKISSYPLFSIDVNGLFKGVLTPPQPPHRADFTDITITIHQTLCDKCDPKNPVRR